MIGILLKFYGLGLFLITLVTAARADLATELHDVAWLMYAPGYYATMLAGSSDIPYASHVLSILPAYGKALDVTQRVILFAINIAVFMVVVLARGLFLMPDTATRNPVGIIALPMWLYFIGIMAFGLIMSVLSH